MYDCPLNHRSRVHGLAAWLILPLVDEDLAPKGNPPIFSSSPQHGRCVLCALSVPLARVLVHSQTLHRWPTVSKTAAHYAVRKLQPPNTLGTVSKRMSATTTATRGQTGLSDGEYFDLHGGKGRHHDPGFQRRDKQGRTRFSPCDPSVTRAARMAGSYQNQLL